MFLKDTWYVAGWSHELDDGAMLARKVAGKPLLFLRTADGQVAAMADRCCHRHAPLSAGRREGDCVRCMYHGLMFDTKGRCIEVPGQKAVPAALQVQSYTAVEHNRWIFVWLGDPARADRSRLPDTFSLNHPNWHYIAGYEHWPIDQQLLVDNLVDFSHLSFVHAKTLGGSALMTETKAKLTRSDDGVDIEWWLYGVEPSPFVKKVKHFPGLVDRWFRYSFTLPGVLVMHSGSQNAGTGAPEGRYDDSLVETRSCQAVMPETESSSHYFFSSPHNLDDPDGRISAAIFASLREAFAEDRAMIEAQQARIRDSEGEPMIALPFDSALYIMRRLREQRLAAQTDDQITPTSREAVNVS